jgi:hypothetical protein
MTGSDEVLDAAFRRCGVLRVTDIGDVFHRAEVLGKRPRPSGPRLTIVTNAGGPAVLATDTLVATGGALAALGADTSPSSMRPCRLLGATAIPWTFSATPILTGTRAGSSSWRLTALATACWRSSPRKT